MERSVGRRDFGDRRKVRPPVSAGRRRVIGRRRLALEWLEDRRVLHPGPLVGVDFGSNWDAAPPNWTHVDNSGGQWFFGVDNLPDDTGQPTAVDLQVLVDSGAAGAVDFVPAPAQVPAHAYSLSGVDGELVAGGGVRFKFLELQPYETYGVYVFGGYEPSAPGSSAHSQQVTVQGAGDAVVFEQRRADELFVNGQAGSNAPLETFLLSVMADEFGKIVIQVDSLDVAGSVYVPALAIQEASPPVPGTIAGTKWNDRDGDGFRDAGEEGSEGQTIFLDDNRNGQLDLGERATVTGADGGYVFTGVPPGEHVIAETVRSGWEQTSPRGGSERLFAVRGVGPSSRIEEFDPADGAILRTFDTPRAVQGPGGQGLAAGPHSLFYVDASGSFPEFLTVYELDPDTGAVLDEDPVDWNGSGPWTGLAYLDGRLYLGRAGAGQLSVWDPEQDVLIATLTVTQPLGLGLTGAADLNLLFSTTPTGSVVGLNPATGMVVRSFVPEVGGLDDGLAYYDGQLWASRLGLAEVYRLSPLDGTDLGRLVLPGSDPLAGLAGEGLPVQAAPGERLFAVQGSGVSTVLMELDPSDGSLVRSLPLPAPASPQTQARLAVGPGSLFYVDGSGTGPHTLWELDPDTGAVLDADVLDAALPFEISGLGYVGGKVFLSNPYVGLLRVWDPLPDVEEAMLKVSADIGAGLTGAADQGLLFGSSFGGVISAIDPQSGAVVRSFSVPASLDSRLAYRDGELLVPEYPNSSRLWRLDAVTGAWVGEFTPAAGFITALGSDGVPVQAVERPQRLFGLPGDGSNEIVELHPDTGWELRRIPAPEATTARSGLAFDGVSLFLLNQGSGARLWQLDPDTGEVLDVDPVPIVARVYDGLAALGGKLYLLDVQQGDILEYDPGTDVVTPGLDINGLNPSIAFLAGGLAGISGPDALLATVGDQSIVEIDPATGLVTRQFSLGDGPGEFGIAVVEGAIYAITGAAASGLTVFSREGAVQRSLALSSPFKALGGDDVSGLAAPSSHTVSVAEGQIVVGQDFGNWQPGEICGFKWHDSDGDGVRDAGEPGLSGWTMFLDDDGDRVLDPGERITMTDAFGRYIFDGLPAGDYTVAEVPRSGWQQTQPAGSAPTARGVQRLFAVPSAWDNRDVVELDPADGHELARWTAPVITNSHTRLAFDGTSVFLLAEGVLWEFDPDSGAIRDRDLVTAGLVNDRGLAAVGDRLYLLDGNLMTVRVFDPAGDVVLQTLNLLALNPGLGMLDGLAGIAGPDRLISIRLGDRALVEIDPATGLASEQAARYEALPGGLAVFEGGLYVASSATPGRVPVYSPAGRWLRTLDLPYGVVALGGDDREEPVAGVGYPVTLTAGAVAAGVDFGNWQPAEIRGMKWNDLNGNGWRDDGEPGLAGWTVFLDENQNGIQDGVSEPATVTDADGNYRFANLPAGTHVVSEVRQEHWVQTAPLGDASRRLVALDAWGDAAQLDLESGWASGRRVTDWTSPQGFAVSADGSWYTIQPGGSPALPSLWRIDPVTGVSTLVGQLGLSDPAGRALDVAPTTDALYIAGRWNGSNVLFRVSTASGQATPVASLPSGDWSAMAFDSATTLYLLDAFQQRLIHFDKTMGQVLSSVPLSVPLGTNAGLEYDPAGGLLYVASRGGLWDLASVDPQTGVVTPVGLPDDGFSLDVIGLQFVRPANAHGVVLSAGQIARQRDFGNQALAEIQGIKWEDRDGDGEQDTGEPALPGWTIYLDENQNGRLDPGREELEPDEFPAGTVVDQRLPDATLSAVGDGIGGSHVLVHGGYDGAEHHGFAHSGGLLWTDASQRLRVDFTMPAVAVSFDFIPTNPYGPRGRLDAYDAAGQLLATALATGTVGFYPWTMTIERPAADIAYVLAGAETGGQGYLDRLVVYRGFGELLAVTGPDGSYQLTDVPPGAHAVGEVLPADWQQAYPGLTAAGLELASVAQYDFGTTGSGNGPSGGPEFRNTPALSGDGRYVAFYSLASNLVPQDTNSSPDAFLLDRQTGVMERISRGLGGAEANGPSGGSLYVAGTLSLSADGRFVAFQSQASNLVANDHNLASDIFVYDRQAGQMERVSVDCSGVEATDSSYHPALSADGRYVVFQSQAGNLVTGDTNGQPDIFVHDRLTHRTERVSVATGGWQLSQSSSEPAISGDGRYVAFSSTASLRADDTWGSKDVFVHDRSTGQTEYASVGFDGAVAAGSSSVPALSGDGRWVAFCSSATNLDLFDTDSTYDIFVYDRLLKQTQLVSQAAVEGGTHAWSIYVAISADGRRVAFYSAATNLVAGDTNGQVDAFVWDRDTESVERLSVADDGTEGNQASGGGLGDGGLALSADGRFAAFATLASNLVSGDENSTWDVLVNRTPAWQPGRYALRLAAAELRTDVDFGNWQPAEIRGVKWNDRDGDGVRDPGEPPLAGRTIFLDLNEDGVLNAGEPATTTEADGSYALTGLLPGSYVVAETVLSDWQQSHPAGAAAAPVHRWFAFAFDGSNQIAELNPADGSELRRIPAPEVVSGHPHGLAYDGRSLFFWYGGSQTLWQLDPETGDVIDQDPLDATAGFLESLAVLEGRLYLLDLAHSDLVEFDPVSDRVTRVVHVYGSGGSVGLAAGGLAAITEPDAVFAIAQGQRLVEIDPQTGAVHRTWKLPASASYSGLGVVNGELYVRTDSGISVFSREGTLLRTFPFTPPAADFGADDVPRAAVAGGTHRVTVGANEVATGKDFGNWQPAEVRGRKWSDLDGDGQQDAGEPGLPGWTIYVDLDGDGQRDAGEPGATTGADGSYALTGLPPGTHSVREVLADHWEQTSPGSIPPALERVSVTADGTEGDRASYGGVFSADGRYVAFASDANLVPDDTNGVMDVFVCDRWTGEVERVSVTSEGQQTGGQSSWPAISADGRYVAFQSYASNLVLDDNNGVQDVFVYDRQSRTSERISVNEVGGEGYAESFYPSISADGRYVAFASASTNLAPFDMNAYPDVFVRDRLAGTTRLLSVAADGFSANRESGAWPEHAPRISGDGRFVVFASLATNLVPNDTNLRSDVFLSDLRSGALQRVNLSSAGWQANHDSRYVDLSGDGRYVLFTSDATNLAGSPDTNGVSDVFVRDVLSGTTARVSVTSGGVQANAASATAAISADGRYVAFTSTADNLVAGDTNGYSDVFVVNRDTGAVQRVSLASGGAEAADDVYLGALSGDGRLVSLVSLAANLVDGDTNGVFDVFVTPSPAWQAQTHAVVLVPGQAIVGVDFGNTELGEIRGSKWNDLDGDGQQDAGEPPLAGWTVFLDDNRNGRRDYGERTALTDAHGAYTFSGVRVGEYVVAEVQQSGWQQSAPGTAGERLYAVRGIGGTSRIEELSPVDGAVIRSFPTPVPIQSFGAQGLAVGPHSLFYADTSSGTTIVFELDPDTGMKLDADIVYRVPSTWTYSLAYFDGRLYLGGGATSPLQVWDPVSDRTLGTLTVTAATFSASLGAGLAGAADLGLLFNSNSAGEIYAIDPADGQVVRAFNPGVGALTQGLAYRQGVLWAVGGSGTTVHRIDPQDGRVLSSFAVAGSGTLTGLGSDGVVVQAAPRQRLFALRGYGPAAAIYELNPTDGTVRNSFSPPAPPTTYDPNGLAVGPHSLFFIDGAGNVPHTLWELDPDTGEALDSDVVDAGDPFEIAGLAYLNGKVFLDRGGADGLAVWNPETDTRDADLPVKPSLRGGLAGAADWGLLFGAATDGKIQAIDPRSGDVLYTLSPGLGQLTGLAYHSGTLWVVPWGSTQASRLDPASGASRGTVPLGGEGALSGLGGDGVGVQLNAPPSAHTIDLAAGQVRDGIDFGNWQPAEIRGVKWDDRDADGNPGPDEPGLAGWTVFLDDDADGMRDPDERFTTTDASGVYAFTDLPPGDYTVAEVPQSGWQQSHPGGDGVGSQRLFAVPYVANNYQIIELNPADGSEIRRLTLPFLVTGDTGLAYDGVSLFVLLTNGALYEVNPDTGLVLDYDMFTGGGGSYRSLAAVDDRLYILDYNQVAVHEFDPVADRLTRTLNLKTINPWLSQLYGLAGISHPNALISVDSARTVIEFDLQTGRARSQFAAYGQSVTGLGVVDGNIFLGSYLLPDVVRVYSRSGVWQRTFPLSYGVSALGADDQRQPVAGAAHTVTLPAAGLAADVDFGNWQPAEIRGTKYHDLDGDGGRDPGEPGLAGWTIYVDQNQNGELDAVAGGSEPWTVTDTAGNYQFLSLPPGLTVVRELPQAEWESTAPGADPEPALLALTSTGYLYELDPQAGLGSLRWATGIPSPLGLAAADGFLYALSFASGGALPLTLYRIDPRTGQTLAWLTTDLVSAGEGDLEFDPAGDTLYFVGWADGDEALCTVSLASGTVHAVGPLPDGDWSALAFTPAGSLYALDTAGDRLVLLDSRTAAVLSSVAVAANLGTSAGMDFDPASGLLYVADNGSGTGSLLTLDPATGQVTPRGPTGTPAPLDLVGLQFVRPATTNWLYLNAGQHAADVDFGNRALAEVRGVKWEDRDWDGILDAEEPPLAGWTMYLDQDQDGQWDQDAEPAAVTAADGSYRFTGLPASLYSVREELPAGWLQTYPGLQPEELELVSLRSDGQGSGSGPSGGLNELRSGPALSADGRYVAFSSLAGNLVPNDGNAYTDTFVYDRLGGTMELVSRGLGGLPGDGHSGGGTTMYSNPALSADGRFVAFHSYATNLVVNDVNNLADIFVYDRQLGSMERVNVNSSGGAASGGHSYTPSLSADGRYVAFVSYATNLASGDSNSSADVFVHDRQTHTTERVSVSNGGFQLNGYSLFPVISGDGRLVTFYSSASVRADDPAGSLDVFVHDRHTHQTEYVSVGTDGSVGSNISVPHSLSADGRYVSFMSMSSKLVPDDTNGRWDVFVYDRWLRQMERVSVGTGGVQSNGDSSVSTLSADGRFVAFYSLASNLAGGGDNNGAYDAFLHDRRTGQTRRLSVATDGSGGNAPSGGSYTYGSVALSADGRFAAFYSLASNFVPTDNNTTYDVFVTPTTAWQPGSQVRDVGPGAVAGSVDFGNVPIKHVVGRYVFYNNSAWDGNRAATDDEDYAALAPAPSIRGHGHAAASDEPDKELGKTALLPGQTATFQNYTSYAQGLNGIMIAFDDLLNPAVLTAADFEFRVGNDNLPSGWELAPVPSGFRVHQDVASAPFTGSPDVVTITWADDDPATPGREKGAISDQWLQVVVLANARTGLAAPDVFYFGHAGGESGDVPADTLVDAYDAVGAAEHPHDAGDPAAIADPYDFDRDQRVDAADQALATAHSTDPNTCLWMLDLRESPLPRISVSMLSVSLAEDDSGRLIYRFTRNGMVSAAATVTFRVTGTAAFPSDYTVSGAASFDGKVGTVTFAAGSSTAVMTIDPIADDEVEGDETAWLLVLPGADYAVGSPVHAAGTIANDDTGTLIVTRFEPTDTGFVARFGRDLEPSVLNLYDSATQTLGPADVSVTGATHGPVHGSLLVSADLRYLTFVRSGGLLEPDTYTVTLFSGVTRFREPAGETLDGNADGTAGDDYQTTFTVSARPVGTVTISVPDMARGAGQPVNVPNAGTGLPIRVDNAAGVTSLAADLRYDPALLNITAAALAAGIPADWSVTLNTGTLGLARVTASGATPLSGSDLDIVRLTAAVPGSAPYGAVQAIRLDNVSLNGGTLAAIGDVAVHKAAYLGDADGSGIHSSADAFLTVQAALGLASGFAAHAWTDPLIVADADGSGVLSAADAFLIVQEGLGLSEPFVPDNPHIGVTPVGGGVDPQFRIDVNLPASAGGLVTVPVKLAIEPAATNVGAFDFDLFFDPARLTIQVPGGLSAGADTAGWAVSAALVAPGQLRVGMVSSSGQPLAPGLREIARLQFRLEPSRMGLRPVQGAPENQDSGDLRSAVSARSGDLRRARIWGGSETHPTWLDIEPVDARAGGYTWTAADGSVLIRPVERTLAGATRERVWRDMDAKAELLESVLSDLVREIASAWP